MQGANDRTLQELLGHKTPRMVLRYAHLSPTHLWQAVEGLTKMGVKTETQPAPKPAPARGEVS